MPPPPENQLPQPVPVPAPTTTLISSDNILQLLFRFGFASIFFVNSIYAALRPQEFTNLLYNNPVTSFIGYADLLVTITMVNDFVLGVLILSGWRKKYVFAWAGVWLLMVTGIKVMNLVL